MNEYEHKRVISGHVCIWYSTYISTREGGEELELVEGKPLGRNEVKKDLELTAAQETPFQELAAWCANSQFADLRSGLIHGLWR